MKYWKGTNSKNGRFGTMEDNGFVPDAVECTKAEYEAYVASIPIVPPTKTDIEKVVEYAKLQGWI